jgi:hypothetical protein
MYAWGEWGKSDPRIFFFQRYLRLLDAMVGCVIGVWSQGYSLFKDTSGFLMQWLAVYLVFGAKDILFSKIPEAS